MSDAPLKTIQVWLRADQLRKLIHGLELADSVLDEERDVHPEKFRAPGPVADILDAQAAESNMLQILLQAKLSVLEKETS